MHRITGDGPPDLMIGPMWSLNKWEVLNSIDAEFVRRGSWQGKICKMSEETKMKLERVLPFARSLLAERLLKEGRLRCRCNLGNGHDTLLPS